MNAVGPQHPVGPPGRAFFARAGGVGGVVHVGAVAVDEIHPHGLAMRAVAQEAIARVGKEPLKGIHAQLQRRALVHIARAVDAHLPRGPGHIVGHGVFHALGTDHGVAPAQFGVALDLGAHIGLAGDAVAQNEHREL